MCDQTNKHKKYTMSLATTTTIDDVVSSVNDHAIDHQEDNISQNNFQDVESHHHDLEGQSQSEQHQQEHATPLLPEDDSFQENEASQQQQIEEQVRRSRFKKALVALVLLGFVIFVIVDSTTNQYIRKGIESFLRWIEDNPAAGAFLFSLVYFLATILFVPGLILTLGAGFVFGNAFGLGAGLVIATLAVFVGASAGAIVSFLLGRYLLRGWVEGLTKKFAIVEALDVAFEEKGLRIMSLLRLSPIIPFNAVNYIAGVTAISFRNYCLALICILPGTILYVFVGSSAGSLTGSADNNTSPAVTIVVIVLGIVFGVLAIVVTSIYAKRELKNVVAAREAEKEAERQATVVDETAAVENDDSPQESALEMVSSSNGKHQVESEEIMSDHGGDEEGSNEIITDSP